MRRVGPGKACRRSHPAAWSHPPSCRGSCLAAYLVYGGSGFGIKPSMRRVRSGDSGASTPDSRWQVSPVTVAAHEWHGMKWRGRCINGPCIPSGKVPTPSIGPPRQSRSRGRTRRGGGIVDRPGHLPAELMEDPCSRILTSARNSAVIGSAKCSRVPKASVWPGRLMPSPGQPSRSSGPGGGFAVPCVSFSPESERGRCPGVRDPVALSAISLAPLTDAPTRTPYGSTKQNDPGHPAGVFALSNDLSRHNGAVQYWI